LLFSIGSIHTYFGASGKLGAVHNGPDDGTRAYVIMPAHQIFEEHARRVEREMGPKHTAETGAPRTKVCPACSSRCDISARACHECDEEFPIGHSRLKACGECGSQIPLVPRSAARVEALSRKSSQSNWMKR
jgi:DNA-directed RNA polymerase subunit RPC12/RpoP